MVQKSKNIKLSAVNRAKSFSICIANHLRPPYAVSHNSARQQLNQFKNYANYELPST